MLHNKHQDDDNNNNLKRRRKNQANSKKKEKKKKGKLTGVLRFSVSASELFCIRSPEAVHK